MDWMEIFALLTGLAYILLEIRQKNLMWVVGIITGLAAMYVFWKDALYASFGLNTYYVTISFWGFYQWRRDAAALDRDRAVPESSADVIHLNRLSWTTVAGSAASMMIGTACLIILLDRLGDPMSGMDAAAAVLSAIATYWLSRSYKEQWLLWIVADMSSTVLCFTQELYWMSALYLAYTLAAVYGYRHWSRHGRYVDSE